MKKKYLANIDDFHKAIKKKFVFKLPNPSKIQPIIQSTSSTVDGQNQKTLDIPIVQIDIDYKDRKVIFTCDEEKLKETLKGVSKVSYNLSSPTIAPIFISCRVI